MAPLGTEEKNATSDDISQQKQMEEFFQWSANEYREPETMGQKFKRKIGANPLVPVGELNVRNIFSWSLYKHRRPKLTFRESEGFIIY